MKIGKITSIQFNQFKVQIFSDIKGGSLNVKGEVYYFGNIGSYLKTTNTLGETIICEVIAIFDSDAKNVQQTFNIGGNRELLLKPIGTYQNKNFSLGIGIYPSLYSDVKLVKSEDLNHILVQQGDNYRFELGISKNLINYRVEIGIDSFFNIHSAILGSSGSGKSNTIAHILQSIYKNKNPSVSGARIIIFDVNGEYKQAFQEGFSNDIKIKYFKPNIKNQEDGYKPFYMPHFLMNLDEWSAFLLATDATQKPFWDKVLQEAYRFYKISNSNAKQEKYINYLRHKLCFLAEQTLKQTDSDTVIVTTTFSLLSKIISLVKDMHLQNKNELQEIIQDAENLREHCKINFGKQDERLSKVLEKIKEKVKSDELREIYEQKIKNEAFFDYKFLKISTEFVLLDEEVRGNKMMRGYVSTMLNRLDYFLENSECDFMRENSNNIKDKQGFMHFLWGKEGEENQLIIIDTSELETNILETLTSVVSRLIFTEKKREKGEGRRKNPVHLILDEAHRYIRKDYKYLLKDNIFERIAREGRKYSLYLLISSQRPAELSETVLSQCANFIIHRIQNENDMRHIYSVLPYFSDDFVNKIKQSVPGEALVFGNCVPMPMHIKIYKSNPEPHSKNCEISKEWFRIRDT
ncbi:DUF87 domain-containing protein [Campylobacter sp.]|uniref:ATP-binding protein n=1 Tax=Campylobacter sp. TaxID=205 RepID=UPI0025C61BDC|nr:DUF87 domain-containing protein [Campylobacter sp.]